MMHRVSPRAAIVLTSLLLTLWGWVGAAAAQNAQGMYERASALTKLTAHVEATVLYGSSPAADDQSLITQAFQANPAAAPLLSDYAFRLLRRGKGVVLLMCTADGARAVLEDASCTAAMDKHFWRDDPNRTCEFSRDAAAVCE